MRKFILFIFFLFINFSSIYSQNLNLDQKIQNSSDRAIAEKLKNNLKNQWNNTWNIGSAKKLDGDIFLLEVWITEEGTKWDYTEMCNLQYEINLAKEWLEKTAKNYGHEVRFQSGSYAGNNYEGIQMKNLPKSYEDASNFPLLLPQAIKKIGFKDILNCYDYLKDLYNTENIIVLILINNDGWSCTYNYSLKHKEYILNDYYLENSYIFASNNGYKTGAKTIAHEILHQFGAWDMYEGQVSKEADLWARSNYPLEIMLQTSSALNDLMVSPLTAWLIGLSDEFYEWFWYFIRNENPVLYNK